MWGSVLTEANTLTNFNFGFSTYKSDILLHLSQWQYWWWFWFSLFWAVYFFIIIRLLNKKSFAFNPTLNTSIRGHGKWGDFLVALIPLSWCGNILVNSNFILRMIEWQNESSLFTIRVQGKQWYWVYKFDATAAQAIYTAPKNIGHNRWFVITPTESYCSDTYYQALNLGTQLEFKKLYYKYLSNDDLNSKNLNVESLQSSGELLVDHSKLNFNPSQVNILKKISALSYLPLSDAELYAFYLSNSTAQLHLPYNSYTTSSFSNNFIDSEENTLKSKKILETKSYYDYDSIDDLSNFAANIAQCNNNKPLLFVRGILNKHTLELFANTKNSLPLPNFKDKLMSAVLVLKGVELQLPNVTLKKQQPTSDERMYAINGTKQMYAEFAEKYIYTKPSIEVGKYTYKLIKDSLYSSTYRLFDVYAHLSKFRDLLLKNFISDVDGFTSKPNKNLLAKPILFNILFNSNSGIVEKVEDSEVFWGFRQKKYKRFKNFLFNQGFIYDSKTLLPIKASKNVARQLKGSLVSAVNLEENVIGNSTSLNYHKTIKFNRHRSELVPVNLARRLLRTKRTLVLPAHVNITLISNSYDVVHSWFIPGLGLKIDCVPGRSTHHTFYIDNIGFYYGQCAEICGRYHHHMPIRLCALSFEHFLVWWQKKGLKRLNRLARLGNSKFDRQQYLNGSSGSIVKG